MSFRPQRALGAQLDHGPRISKVGVERASNDLHLALQQAVRAPGVLLVAPAVLAEVVCWMRVRMHLHLPERD